MADDGPSSSTKTIALLGDVMLGRGVNEQIDQHEPDWFWGDTLAVLRSADAVICNLECAITIHRTPWSRTHKVFHFRADPEAVDVLRAAHVRCVSLANNHILDYQVKGLFDTIEALDKAQINHAGAGANSSAARRPAVFPVGDCSVALLAATDNEPPFMATSERPGTNYIDITGDPKCIDRVADGIAAAREDGADVVVLSLHWGPNMVERPPRAFRDFARAAVERGADIVHGHSAHILQAVDVHKERPILYDTGDFLDDYAVDPQLHNDWSMIFLVDIDDRTIARLRLLPVQLSYAQVNLARGEMLERIRTCFRKRCNGFETPLQETDEGFEILMQQSATPAEEKPPTDRS